VMGRGLTHAGNSFRALKTICDYDPVCAPDDDEKLREFYHGGRVTPYKRYLDRGVMIDMNSAYPWAMQYGHPEQCGEWEKVFSFQKTGVGFYQVKSESKGVFPWKNNGILSFPDDEKIRIFNVTSHEIKAALRIFPKMKIQIIYGYHYENLISFRPFVDKFFCIKQNAVKDSIEYQLAKLTLNAGGYGKMGMDLRGHDEMVLLPPGKVPNRKLLKDGTKEHLERWKQWDAGMQIGMNTVDTTARNHGGNAIFERGRCRFHNRNGPGSLDRIDSPMSRRCLLRYGFNLL
jgi:hypothetical protein